MQSHEKLQPEQQFIKRFGVEPTPLNIDWAGLHLFAALDEYAVSLRYLNNIKDNHDYNDRYTLETSARHHATRAMLYLFTDGPINSFPVLGKVDVIYGTRTAHLTKYSHSQPHFSISQIKSEFESAIDLLSFTSKRNLRMLKDFIGQSPGSILGKAKSGEIEVDNDVIDFLINRGFMTPEERLISRKNGNNHT